MPTGPGPSRPSHTRNLCASIRHDADVHAVELLTRAGGRSLAQPRRRLVGVDFRSVGTDINRESKWDVVGGTNQTAGWWNVQHS